MVRWMRTARISHGAKFGEAVTWAKDVAAFVEKKHKGPKIDVYVDAFGEVGTIRWMVDYDNLASLEATQTGILRDSEYFQKLKEAENKGLFIPGEIDDVVMRAM